MTVDLPEALTGPVLAWYAEHARDLPWRSPGVSPWAVLVSEVMLQQTPVARVLPVWEAWLDRWPTPAALAADSLAEDTVDWIRGETGGYGADFTFEATGNVGVMQQAVEAAREAWGVATMIGVAGKGETLDVVPRLLITGRRVTGSSFGGVKGRSQVPELVDRWLAGEIDVDALVTARIPLDEVNDAFDAMERQEGIRTVISFS